MTTTKTKGPGAAARICQSMSSDLGDLPGLFDDDGEHYDLFVASVAGVQADDDREALRIDLRFGAADGRTAARQIACSGVVTWTLRDDDFDDVWIADEHPALLPYREPRSELYFSGGPGRDPEVTAALLHQAWFDLLQGYVPFETHVNRGFGTLAALLGQTTGLVARGPVSVMLALAEVLAAAGLAPSVVDLVVQPNRPGGLRVLVLGPSSWVVGRRFVVS